MTASDALSRLRAGLDRDEALARAAAKREGEQWSVTHIPYEGITVWAAGDSDLPGYVDERTEHIQHHDPARVLRQAEKLREVAAILGSVNDPGPELDPWAICGEIAELLAGIYPTETGDPA